MQKPKSLPHNELEKKKRQEFGFSVFQSKPLINISHWQGTRTLQLLCFKPSLLPRFSTFSNTTCCLIVLMTSWRQNWINQELSLLCSAVSPLPFLLAYAGPAHSVPHPRVRQMVCIGALLQSLIYSKAGLTWHATGSFHPGEGCKSLLRKVNSSACITSAVCTWTICRGWFCSWELGQKQSQLIALLYFSSRHCNSKASGFL